MPRLLSAFVGRVQAAQESCSEKKYRQRERCAGKKGRRGGSMKFIHIADVHLGAQPDAGRAYSKERPRELWDALERVLEVCEKEQTDLLLIAGDLFHRQPLLRELKELDYLFSELSHTKVVLIVGNHDYIRRDSYYRMFRWNGNVIPLLGRNPEYVEFPELRTAVYGFSYHSREIREPLCDGLFAQGKQMYEILLAHGGDEKHVPMNMAALEKSGFDYIALGHIHKPQALVKNRIAYSGALEPTDRNDTGPHGYVRGEILPQGVRTQWIPCACREYVHLEVQAEEEDTSGSLKKKIYQRICEYGKENIYKIVIKGRKSAEIVFDTKHMDEFGNIVEIVDESRPAYDFAKLLRENSDNLIGKYIEAFSGCSEDSVEYQAMCEGVEALLENKGLQE